MGLLKQMGLLAGIGTTLYLLVRRDGCCRKRATGDDNGAAPVHSSGVMRDAGPDEQRDPDGRLWDKVDEQSDESFPASDPPANY